VSVIIFKKSTSTPDLTLRRNLCPAARADRRRRTASAEEADGRRRRPVSTPDLQAFHVRRNAHRNHGHPARPFPAQETSLDLDVARRSSDQAQRVDHRGHF
jgi:hypothetical protein